MAGKNCQSCRHTHSHTHTHAHIYPPCHDAHQETPSRLLAPRAPPVRVDILRKHTQYQKCARTGAETDLCRCTWLMLCFFFFWRQVCFSLHYSETLCSVSSLRLTSPRLIRGDADTTHLLVERRQTEQDCHKYSAAETFHQLKKSFKMFIFWPNKHI